ncbi:hypothetical protein P9209_11210 [Prescottella defluvii]|nr:hypothetical protein P9209_11210 [Prescottella defluvii]
MCHRHRRVEFVLGRHRPELDPNQNVQITFESYNLTQAGPWTDAINGLIADFEAAHPNIDVKAQPPRARRPPAAAPRAACRPSCWPATRRTWRS